MNYSIIEILIFMGFIDKNLIRIRIKHVLTLPQAWTLESFDTISIAFLGSILWNSTPEGVKNRISQPLFSKNIRRAGEDCDCLTLSHPVSPWRLVPIADLGVGLFFALHSLRFVANAGVALISDTSSSICFLQAFLLSPLFSLRGLRWYNL